MKSIFTIAVIILSLLTFPKICLSETDSSPGFSMMPTTPEGQQRREKFKKNFLQRLRKDSNTLTPFQLKEIEDLYQVANIRPRTPEAKQNLLQIISTPDWEDANRTGCAFLYLATNFTEGEEMEVYLKTAIQSYSDCWYGDGVQVGAYGRYLLGKYYWGTGRKEEAVTLFNELKDTYPDSIGHCGELLVDKIPK
ncbi:MAG: hypothetical protein JW774_03865 [Candidatus Aureabacteria bacterium]|nr:hypothetical protein [Candidatus Auribacterota bacterium]